MNWMPLGILSGLWGRNARIAGLVVCLLLIAAVSLTSYFSLLNSIEANRSIRHAQRVMYEIAKLAETMDETESAQRGYLLTGDKSFLRDYDDSVQRISASLSKVRDLVAANPAQVAHLDALEPLLRDRLALLTGNLKYRTATGLSMPDPSRFLRGQQLMEQIDGTIAPILDAEQQILPVRAEAVAAHDRSVAHLLLLGSIGSVIFVGGIFLLLDQEAKRRKKAESLLQASNLELEARISARTAELQRSERQLRLFVEGAPAAIAMFDRELRYISVSRRFIEDYRVKEGDLIGRSHYEIFPEMPERWRDIHRRCLAGAVERCEEDPFPRADGQVDWVRWEIRPWYEDEATIGGIILFSEVITERKRAAQQRERLEAKMKAVVESAVDGIITISQDGVVQTFSGPAERIFGYAADEVVGQNIAMLMPEPDRSRHGSYLQNYLRTGVAKIIGIGREVQGRRKDGTLFPMDLAVGELPPLDGKREFVGTVRDISERRKLEDQLRQSQKMEAVGQLTGGIAHDFNNLLGVVVGNLDAVLEKLDERSEQAQLIGRALSGAMHGAELTHRLLAFSRQQPLEPTAFAINDLLPDLSAILKRTLGEGIAVHVETGIDLWPAFADPSQVQDAIVNLAINARDAMPDGGTLTIETANIHLDEDYVRANPGATPGDYAMLAVTDTGTGMSAEVAERAVEPFFTTKPVGKGTGLGLSMIYGFARQSGGHLKIYSEVGHGTAVKLYLPRAKVATAPEQRPAEVTEQIPGGTETILLAEDNAELRHMAVYQLEKLGYRVLAAQNGEAALAVLRGAEPIDLLFSDIVMTGKLTGTDLVSEARKLRPNIRILLTTGYAEKAVSNSNQGAWHLLRKPYRKRDLALKVRGILDQD
jgi:PAS domain S-box-containing protein